MKHLFVITLASILCLFIFSCGNGAESSTAETTTATDPHAGHNHAGHDHAGHNHDGHDHAAHASDDNVIRSSPLSPFIGIWSYFASSHKKDAYKNHWIEFKGDETFTYGIGSKQTNKGVWKLNWEEKIVDFDFENNTSRKDEQWKIMLNPPVLLLLGNSPLNGTGEQIKLDKVETRPVG